MIGVMYHDAGEAGLRGRGRVALGLTGTGLKNGDVLKKADGTSFLGYEVDAMGPGRQRTRSGSPTRRSRRRRQFSDMTIYRANSGATVFATGSIGWSVDLPQAQQIMRNVLARLVDNAFADTTPVRPALPAPFTSGESATPDAPDSSRWHRPMPSR